MRYGEAGRRTGSVIPLAIWRDCLSAHEAESAATEWASQDGWYAFVRAKDACECDACRNTPHASSCAVPNGPALTIGNCDCIPGIVVWEHL